MTSPEQTTSPEHTTSPEQPTSSEQTTSPEHTTSPEQPTSSEQTTSPEAIAGIDPGVPPSGDGCMECLAAAGWWFHLRRCAQCGHIGCCDASPSQHARAHAVAAGHPIMCSFEPGEDWFWDFDREAYLDGPAMTAPLHHPVDQPVPGPAGGVPRDWMRQLR